MKTYKKRIADDVLKRKLEGKSAVLIEGPKWCGKTTTAVQHAASILYMNDPASMQQNISMAELSPHLLLSGATPRLIDEWQLAPKLWDAVRFESDRRGEPGQFILTGSAVPPQTNEIKHSGTGRFAWMTMRTMSLFESDESSGEVSLRELFSSFGDVSGTAQSCDIARLAFFICRGGWPQAIGMRDEIALDQATDYFDGVIHSDIGRADGVAKNPERARRLMRSYARAQGSQTSFSAISKDLSGGDASLGDDTVSSYVSALKKIFVIEDMPSWNPNLRSKTAIRSSDTRYYTDPSIAAAALGVCPEDLLADLNTMGLLFETLAVRDLRVYAESLGGNVYHYRDKDGLECDAVIHMRNGSYCLAEIKLGGDMLIEEGAATLKTLAAKLDTSKMPSPSFLMVVTGMGNYAYRRKDGVLVVPITALKN